jgi:hypothetical protein
MKKLLLAGIFMLSLNGLFAQMGEVWPVFSRQDFDVNDKIEITKTYDVSSVCQFFMFVNNNEFVHVTDNMTSLYKIIKRDESKAGEPLYTVVSEAGNTYSYIFNSNTKTVYAYSTKGFLIEWKGLDHYNTEIFSNLNK